MCLLDLKNTDFLALQQDVQTESHRGLSLLKILLKMPNQQKPEKLYYPLREKQVPTPPQGHQIKIVAELKWLILKMPLQLLNQQAIFLQKGAMTLWRCDHHSEPHVNSIDDFSKSKAIQIHNKIMLILHKILNCQQLDK